MHDGRFRSLEDVLDHYNNGMVKSPTIDASLEQNGRLGIAISADEKTKIIAFLKTLTDEQFLEDRKLSEF
jgi:cytochrome c peroxidase